MPTNVDLQLIPSKPYFPAGGMNIDSNGMGTAEHEAHLIRNMDVHSHDIRSRPGTITIDPYGMNLPQEDILHYAVYKKPNGATSLFAFTCINIYEYSNSTGWNSVAATGLFVTKEINFWSTTCCIDETYGATIVAAGSYIDSPTSALQKGDKRLLCFYNQTSGKFEPLIMYQNTPVIEEQLIEYGGSSPVVAPEAVIPRGGIDGIAFLAKHIDKWQVHSGTTTNEIELRLVVDYDDANPLEPSITVEMWKDTPGGTSTTDVSEAVAAKITITTGREDDPIQEYEYTKTQAIETALLSNTIAAQLLKVDNLGYNVEVKTDSDSYFTQGNTGRVNGILQHDSGDDNFVGITEGSFVITLGTGEGALAKSGKKVHPLPVGRTVLGDASNGANVNCYRMIPTNETIIDFENSWIRVDGKEWQLQFLSDVFAGSELLGSYYYKETYAYNPIHVTTFHNALLVGNLYDAGDDQYYPWRIQWSDMGKITAFDFDNYQDVIVREVAAITGFMPFNTVVNRDAATFLFICQENTISRGTYSQSLFLELDTAIPEGLEYIRTLCSADNMLYYMGKNDFYAFDGLNRESITIDEKSKDSRIREYVFANLDKENMNKNHTVYDPIRRKILFFIMLTTNSETYPTDAFVYDIDKKCWTMYTMPACSASIAVSLELPEVV